MNETPRDPKPPVVDGTAGVRTRIELRTPIPEELAGEIESRVLFVSPEITHFELETNNGKVHGVIVVSRVPMASDALTEKINAVVDGDVRGQRVITPQPVWTSPHHRAVQTGMFDLLMRHGAVSEAGAGQVAVGEPLLSLLAYFDRALRRILAEDFTPLEYRYPTLISTRALELAGYPTSFPHHLMFVTRLHNDLDVYRRFRDIYATTELDSRVFELCRDVDYCLPPTMCYHTFHQYRGRTLATDGVHVVTARGKSFRFEAAYATTLERLWDFTIREIVFMGSSQQIAGCRERFMKKVFAFMEELGLSGRCEAGNDPFFGGADILERIGSQRLLELKYELRLHAAPDRTVAVGSFNYHGDMFGRGFDIRYGTHGPVTSACAGFGLERLVYAFLCQYGLDQLAWPASVRAGIRAVSEV
jgi:seryl-tRNA synthetase